MTLGKPVSIEDANVLVRYISDLPGDDPSRRYGPASQYSSDYTTKYEIGKIAVSAQVAGTFELLDKQQ